MIRCFWLSLLVFLVAGPAFAQASARLTTTLARVLSYDYKLKERAGTSLTIAVVFKNSDPGGASADSWVTAFKTLEQAKISGLDVRVIKIAYRDDLSPALTAEGVDVLFICEGLQAEAAHLRQLARATKRMTVGASETYVKEGMSVGVFSEGNRNRIVVNLSAAKEEGVELSSQLLQLATVIP